MRPSPALRSMRTSALGAVVFTAICVVFSVTGCGGDRAELPALPAAAAALPPPAPLPGWRRSAIDLVLRGRVAQGARSGFVALVAREGRLVHAATVGHRDVEAGLPMTIDTRFQIASMTKPVVATAAMILVEEGRLGLDDPVAAYVPELADVRVAERDPSGGVTGLRAPSGPIRVRHVLSFTSGMGPGRGDDSPLAQRWQREGLYGPAGGSLAERVARLGALPLFFDPGTEWRYGASMDVVARIVEVVAGEPLDRFLARRIFDPLGMAATHYYKDLTPDTPLAVMYDRDEDGTLVPTEHGRSPRDWTPGGTGLVSSAPDYMRFALMLWNEGTYDGVRILAPETVRRMRAFEIESGVLARFGIEGLGFGLGVSVVADADRTILAARGGDFWWGGAYGTHLWISPETGIVVVVMQQRLLDSEDPPIGPGLVQALALIDAE